MENNMEKITQMYLELVHEEMLRRGYKMGKSKRKSKKSRGVKTYEDNSYEDNLFSSLDSTFSKYLLIAAEQ